MNTKLYDFNIIKDPVEGINTEYVPEIISFKLENSSCAVANLLRIFITYHPVKILTCEPHNINSTQYNIVDPIINRIAQIPILQNVDVGTKAIISIANNKNTVISVDSKDIFILPSKKNICTNGNFKIVDLEPNKSITINMIIKSTISKFIDKSDKEINHLVLNKNHGVSLLQTSLKYQILDYQKINLLIDNEITQAFVKTNDIPKSTNKKKILYYVNKEYDNIIKYFKDVHEPNEINKLDEYYDDVIYIKEIEILSSEQLRPKIFSLSLLTYGNIPGKELFISSLKHLITLYNNITITKINNTDEYKINTYEHVAYLLYDFLKEMDIDAIMHIHYVGYHFISFHIKHANGEELIKKTITTITTLITNIIKDIR